MSEKMATRDAYGHALEDLGAKHPDVVVFDADLSKSTRTNWFEKKFPDRFFNMGVAEANMVNVAAGMSTCGKVVFASSFCMFISGRAWEQVRNTIGYAHLNVKLCGTHSGLAVGEDGGSHQAIEDIALMKSIPGMTVVVPADGPEAMRATFAAYEHKGPLYMRLGRSTVPTVTPPDAKFEIGKALLLRDGTDAVIVACGLMVSTAIEAAETLQSEGKNVAVVNLHTIKPIDSEMLVRMAKKTGAVVTAEEHVLEGGAGSAVCEVLAQHYPVPVEMVGITDRFGQSGDPDALIVEYGLTADDICSAVKKAIERKHV